MQIYCHRANGFGYIENSAKAILGASHHNTHNIELDLRLSKDNIWMVFHDAYLDRMTKSCGLIKNHTAAELAKMKLIDGQAIPTLKSILKTISKTYTRHLLLEVKSGGEEAQLIHLLKAHKLFARTIIGTWNPRSIETIKEIDKKTKTCLFYVPAPGLFFPIRWHKQFAFDGDHVHICLNKAQHFPPHSHGVLFSSSVPRLPLDAISVPSTFISKRLIRQAHKAGIKVFAFQANSRSQARMLYHKGVDALITDRASNILEQITEHP